MRTKLYYLLYILIFCSQYSIAQTKVQLVEKTVNKKIPLSTSELFQIVGEKADVSIKGWNENYVGLQIIFSARHSDKLVAEKELGYMKYSLSSENKTIEVRNSFILPANVSHIQSSLSVTYKIFIPQRSNLSVTDKYGKIDLRDFNGSTNINSEFADIQLNDVEGKIVIQNSFAELRANSIKGSFVCQSEKSDIYLSGIEGVFDISSSFGSIDLSFEQRIKSLSIKSNRTSITLQTKNSQSYNYDLVTKFGTIYSPENYSKFSKKDMYQSSFRLITDAKKPTLKIQTTYSAITIKF